MRKGYCIYCDKKLKKQFNGKSVHRKCWLQNRQFDDRIFDSLFCIDRQETPAKSFSVKPDNDEKDIYDSLIEDVKREKQSLIDFDDCENDNLCYDIGGNLISIK